MKTKSFIKIVVDIVMTVLFVSLLFAYNTGLAFHEIIGLSMLFLVILHLILNGKWIIRISNNLFNQDLKAKTVFMYFLDIGLLFSLLAIGVTGIMISTVLFPIGESNPAIVLIHKGTSYVAATMLAIHLALHLKYLARGFKKILSHLRTSNIKKALSGTFAIIMIAGIVYYNVISTFDSYIPPVNSSPASTPANNPTQSSDIITPTPAPSAKKKEEATVGSSETASDVPGLTEFLSKMFCTICPKHCPLSNPQCGKSRSLIEEAKTEYRTLYGEGN